MKFLPLLGGCLLALPLLSWAGDANQVPADTTSAVDGLSWLSGCWQHSQREPGSVEIWSQPAGGMLLGVSRIVVKGQTREFEYLRIHVADGQLAYTAKPSGQAEATFKLLRAEGRSLVFENLAHDFPQRILYSLQPDGSLLARIEGQIKGQAKSRDFPMVRTRCEAPSAS